MPDGRCSQSDSAKTSTSVVQMPVTVTTAYSICYPEVVITWLHLRKTSMPVRFITDDLSPVSCSCLSRHWLPVFLASIAGMIDWVVVVLHPTRHKIGHFGDVPQANLLAWNRKTKPYTTKAQGTALSNNVSITPVQCHVPQSYQVWQTTSPHCLSSYCHNLRDHAVVTTVVFGHSTVVNSICSAYLWNMWSLHNVLLW